MMRAKFCDYSDLCTKQTTETKTPNPPEQSQLAVSLLNHRSSSIPAIHLNCGTKTLTLAMALWGNIRVLFFSVLTMMLIF